MQVHSLKNNPPGFTPEISDRDKLVPPQGIYAASLIPPAETESMKGLGQVVSELIY